MRFSRLLVSGFILTGLLQAQSEKVMIQELQRDVAQLQNQIRKFTEAQDQKNAELESLLKQTLDSNAKLAANLGTLQQSLTAAMAEQQGKLVQPINALDNKMDQISQMVMAFQNSMDAMARRQSSSDAKLTEILNNVKTLSATPAAPPPVAVPGGGTAATPGATAGVAFEAAERDFRSGRNTLAMDEFQAFIAQFPASDKAPKAQYYMGVIYDRGEQYQDSVKAYDAVLERYPENDSTADALYGKAVALMKLDQNVEAKKEFNTFLKKYKTDDKVAQVKQYLKDLAAPASPPANQKKGKK